MALTWALLLVVNQYFDLRVFFMVSAFYSFLPSILIYLFDINKRNAISYLMLLGIFPIIALIFWISGTNPVRWAGNVLSWCAAYDGSDELYNRGIANFVVFFIGIIAAILFYLLTRDLIAKKARIKQIGAR